MFISSTNNCHANQTEPMKFCHRQKKKKKRKRRWGKNSRLVEHTGTPSTTHRSPTSKGCITKTNMIASNMVLQVLPNIKAATTSCDERRTSTFVVAIPIKRSQMIMVTITRIIVTNLFNCLTAVLVSPNAWARAFRPL